MFAKPHAQSKAAFSCAYVRSVVFELFGCICIQTKDRAILIRSVDENVKILKMKPHYLNALLEEETRGEMKKKVEGKKMLDNKGSMAVVRAVRA
jgi:hypothetical protein